MTRGPIRRLARDRLERRSGARLLSAWIDTGGARARVKGLTHLSQAKPDLGSVEPGSPVLIMLGPDGDAAYRELVAHADAGQRVYVLVPPTWGRSKVDPRVLEAPTVLIRRVPEPPVSGVHSSGGVRLWLGGSWSLLLDAAQGDAFRQLFLRLFWHDATHEAWSGGSELAWRVAAERPFDVPTLAPDAPVQIVDPKAQLELDSSDVLVHLSSGKPPETTPRRLWFPAGATHHEHLAQIVGEGAEVVWEDRGLPDLAVGPGGGETLLPGGRVRLSIHLNSAQVDDVTEILEASSRWRFGVDMCIGDPEHATALFWLSGEAAARGLENEQRIDLPEVQADTLRAVPETSPTSWSNPQPLALSARYHWTVIPPRLPAGSKEDPLIGRWRSIDEDWIARLDRLRDDLKVSSGERGRIGAAFSRLVSAMLGFARKQTQLEKQVSSMHEQRPSAGGPSEAPSMLARLADVEEQAQALHTDLEETERKASEDDERDKQEAAWRARVDEAKLEVPQRRMELEEDRARRSEIDDELAALEPELEVATKKSRKDLQTRKRKLSDVRTRLQQSIQQKSDTISTLEQAIAEPFEYKPPPRKRSTGKAAGSRFVPKPLAKHSKSVPDEALPEIGALRIQASKRYLVIENWEQLDVGEQAASRLGAELVAPEDV